MSLAGEALTGFVLVGSKLCPAFFALYYQEGGYRIGGYTFLKALYNASLSPPPLKLNRMFLKGF